MVGQPELYGEILKLGSLAEFCAQDDSIAFAIEDDGRLLAFPGLTLKAKGSCEFILITPRHPRVRPIIRMLAELQRSYFEDLGFWQLTATFPDDHRRAPVRKLARLMSWREVAPNRFEHNLADYLYGL